MITTDKVYHNRETYYHYKEDDRLGGHDPYSASKACAELIIDSFRNSFFNPANYSQHQKSVSAARAGNVIGGGDWAPDRIIPDIIRALNADKEVQVRNPLSVRPWQHVLDPLFGYLVLAAHQSINGAGFADAFNFGPYEEGNFTVEQLVNEAIQIWGKGKYHTPGSKDQPHEAGLLHLDINKALTNLDWTPKLNSVKAIERTVEWYKAFLVDGKDASQLIEQDIKEYTAL